MTRRRLTPWMLGVGGVTFLAGLLFGYDQGVISGALPLLKVDLDLSTLESEIVTSWVTLGALFGALVAGGTADRIGRRWTAATAGVLFAVGALIEAVAPGAGVLTVGRLVTGLGVGFASVVAPLYAAEMSPKWLRGRFVSTYQLAITVGILFAYLADDALTGSDRWRLMFGLAVIAGAALVVGFLVMPESARWLLKMGRREDARASLVKVDGPEIADAELVQIEADLAAEQREGQASWGEVMSPSLRRALWVGVGLAVLQQVTGINAIIYYANEIFAEAGFTTAEQQSVVDAIGESTTFFIFAALCVVSFVFVWYLVPETKGRSLEEIQERWVRNGDRMLDERDLQLPPTGPGGAVPG